MLCGAYCKIHNTPKLAPSLPQARYHNPNLACSANPNTRKALHKHNHKLVKSASRACLYLYVVFHVCLPCDANVRMLESMGMHTYSPKAICTNFDPACLQAHTFARMQNKQVHPKACMMPLEMHKCIHAGQGLMYLANSCSHKSAHPTASMHACSHIRAHTQAGHAHIPKYTCTCTHACMLAPPQTDKVMHDRR